MSQLHTLTISGIEKETPESVVVLLKVPGNLMADFAFKAGQYLTLETTIDGTKVRRAYSLCSAPYESVLKVGIKKVAGGIFSVYANEHLQAGDTIEVMPPEGKFIISPDATQEKKYAGFAAGSGITPILSIIKTVLKEEPRSQFFLAYGNKSKAQAMFYTQLMALKEEHPERLHIEFIFSEKTEEGCRFGRIDTPIINYLNNTFDYSTFDAFYLCGPEPMIDLITHTLKEKGINEKNIHFELFTTTEEASVISTQAGKTEVTVMLDDEEQTFTMDQKHTVLEAALAHKIDAPYSCQGGICSSCIARITEGEAHMRKNQILTDAEVAEGLILTCQAQPTSASLHVDYDDV